MMGDGSLHEVAASATRPGAAAGSSGSSGVRFMTLEPGHFHAALVQKSMYPGVSPEVDIYASPGPDLDAHLKRIAGFNARQNRPTSWKLRVHSSSDAFARMLSAPSGNAVIIAGRNRPKIDYVTGAVEHGLNLLVDKPWIIRSEDLDRLEEALQKAKSRGLVAFDIMTERFEVTNALQRVLVNDPEVFGSIETGSADQPAVYMRSVHHIVKEAAGTRLWRPAWFFDIAEQGEALADVGTHLVDLSLWTIFPAVMLDHRGDARVNAARRWPTVMTREEFMDVTGEADFPPALSPWVEDETLLFFANTAVEYELRGIHVKLEALWDRESQHGDTHHAVYRGDRSRIEVRQGEAEAWVPEVYVIPNRPEWKSQVADALRRRVAALQERWEGLGVEEGSEWMRLIVPPRHRLGHEAHFAEVTAEFLSYLEDPGSLPAWETAYMLTKYAITTAGTDLSRAGSAAAR